MLGLFQKRAFDVVPIHIIDDRYDGILCPEAVIVESPDFEKPE